MAAYLRSIPRELGFGPRRWIIKGESAMARTSTAVMAAFIALAASYTSLAQNGTGAPPPGTNSAGTAQSSGGAALNRQPGVTTGSGLGWGNAAPPATTSTDAAINKENQLLDSKMKSICRGC